LSRVSHPDCRAALFPVKATLRASMASEMVPASTSGI
jgi:hypothetical protein